jgi:hypothetical protein
MTDPQFISTTICNRGRPASPTDTIVLTSTWYNSFGVPTNLDFFPSVSLVAPTGNTTPFTSAGVMQIDVGVYGFSYQVPLNPQYGVYQDIWQGTMDGYVGTQTLSFIVSYTEYASTFANSDGYEAIGDPIGLEFSQHAIHNINKCLRVLNTRLMNTAKVQQVDSFGNIIFADCSIFSPDTLTTMLVNSLSLFNEIPYFTFFTFEDTWFIDQFIDVIVEGAVCMALSSQSLIERGREFTINDNGVSFTPPGVSELLNGQYAALLTHNMEKVKLIKASMRPFPKGLGTFSLGSTMNPVVKNLRLLRARQIF